MTAVPWHPVALSTRQGSLGGTVTKTVTISYTLNRQTMNCSFPVSVAYTPDVVQPPPPPPPPVDPPPPPPPPPPDPTPIPPPPLGGTTNAYYDNLIARPDKFVNYSMRTAQQLLPTSQGGFASQIAANSGYWITYDPTNDTNQQRQDAAKVRIPPFGQIVSSTLATSVGTAETTFALNNIDGNWFANRAFKIDSEYCRVVSADLVAKTVVVQRGYLGSTIAAHTAGAALYFNVNSCQSQVRFPIFATDGATYLYTWDGYWTNSFLNSGLENHKCFQLSSGGDQVWLETQTRFSGQFSSGFNPLTDVFSVTQRTYNPPGGPADWTLSTGNQCGPGVTTADPIQPKIGNFNVKAGRWTRFWVRIKQQVNNYDLFDMWVADEQQAAVQIYSQIPVSVRPTGAFPNQIVKFWLEYNTSEDRYRRTDARDFVSYVKNLVVLKNVPADITPLLIKPVP